MISQKTIEEVFNISIIEEVIGDFVLLKNLSHTQRVLLCVSVRAICNKSNIDYSYLYLFIFIPFEYITHSL